MKHNPGALDPLARGLFIAMHLMEGKPVTSAVIRKICGVSRATAKRDLAAIEASLPVEATKGEHGRLTLKLARKA